MLSSSTYMFRYQRLGKGCLNEKDTSIIRRRTGSSQTPQTVTFLLRAAGVEDWVRQHAGVSFLSGVAYHELKVRGCKARVLYPRITAYVCMCVCIYIYIYTHNMYISRVRIHLYIYIYIYIYTCLHLHLHRSEPEAEGPRVWPVPPDRDPRI